MGIDTIKNQNITHKEIHGQPALWESVFKQLRGQEAELKDFLSPLFGREELQIVLTGAGSSAFIGEAAQGIIQKNTGCQTKAIPTTDIVTHPELYLPKNAPTLLVSFARSGNSPESMETVRLADVYCSEVYHFIITCNKNGDLMKYTEKYPENTFPLLLPEAANDKSLAMTGSFTSMLLSVLLCLSPEKMEGQKKDIEKIIQQGQTILDNFQAFKEISEKEFDRVVFLGSGPMLGIARECHLKLQELTDGQIICKHDSFLGFRHGPRAVTNEKTLLVYLFSVDDHVYKYELDLAKSIANDPRNLECLSIGRPLDNTINSCFNVDLDLTPDQELNIVPATLVGQLLGYCKSLQLNLNPDNPSVSGAISRVVKGVVIYDNPKK